MKKVITIILAVILCLVVMSVTAGCGNMSWDAGNFTFTKVHIFTRDGNDRCLTVETWHDGDTGIEVKTEEYGSLFLSEGTYMLCEDECPICNGGGE